MPMCAYSKCHAPVVGPGLRVLGLNERALLFCTRACLLGHYAEVCSEPAPWPTTHRSASVRLDDAEDVSQPFKAAAFLSKHSGIPMTGMTATPVRIERCYEQALARLDGLYAAARGRLTAARDIALAAAPKPLTRAQEPLPDLIEALTG